ncbi:MAG: biotin--[acetyl-CoA-carboxylase] ligase [Clostridia bacterium]|nr:biotin--[acetyl-CoA-carboxylase] ligase [Clostridia bacterium]
MTENNLTTKEKVLAALAESGGDVSGETLAAKLGISRTAVWKAVQTLTAEGAPIETVPRRGYRLKKQEAAYLHETRIQKHLTKEAAETFTLRVEDALPSTNTVLKQMAGEGAPGGIVLIAREQTAGKGRLGRSFLSPAGSGLYMSLLLRPTLPVDQALRITTAAAVAVSEAIEQVRPGSAAKIKWVNDIYMNERKVCGILTEAGMDLETGLLAYAVLGIGINLLPPPGGFPPEIADIAGSVFAPDGGEADGNLLAAEILNRLARMLCDPCSADLLERYRGRSLLDGREILVRRCTMGDSTEIPAVALGIDENAGLRVRYPDGTEESLSSGEVVQTSVHLKKA